MRELLAATNTAAMVLGYIFLALLMLFIVWIAGVWFDKWSYQRRRSRRNDLEWDRIRSKWLNEDISLQRIRTAEHRVIDSADRIDTNVLDIPDEDRVYDYMEDIRSEAS